MDGRPAAEAVEATGQIGNSVQRWAAEAPDRVALLDSTGVWTYGEFASAIAGARSWLMGQGVRPGDRVMLAAENNRPALAILLAVTALQAWPFIVDARLSPIEVDTILAHCQPRILIIAAGVGPAAQALATRFGATSAALPSVGDMTTLIFVSRPAENATPEPVVADQSLRVAAVIYTSGSTGLPKGVMLSHRNILFVAATAGIIRQVTPVDRFYAAMPISHAVGLSSVVTCALLHGASVQLLTRFNPAEALRSFQRVGVTILLGTPSLYALLMTYAAEKSIEKLALPSLRIISASGAPLDFSVKHAAEKLFGLTLHHGYGISECAPTIAQTRLEQPRQDLSVGPLLPGMEARLADMSEKIGRLEVRGPNVMLGYFRDPSATRAMIDADGWCRTGDLARFENDHLFITGRSRELIIRHGYNVMPTEVEAVLNAHPDVVQSAVVGRQGAGEEEVIAYVQLRSGVSLPRPALAHHAAEQLASYKHPSEIRILQAMPMLPSGKVDKRRLVDP